LSFDVFHLFIVKLPAAQLLKAWQELRSDKVQVEKCFSKWQMRNVK